MSGAVTLNRNQPPLSPEIEMTSTNCIRTLLGREHSEITNLPDRSLPALVNSPVIRGRNHLIDRQLKRMARIESRLGQVTIHPKLGIDHVHPLGQLLGVEPKTASLLETKMLVLALLAD